MGKHSWLILVGAVSMAGYLVVDSILLPVLALASVVMWYAENEDAVWAELFGERVRVVHAIESVDVQVEAVEVAA